ncbi:hypothetical protein [uncultured Tateyamaria sp.]|uniref:hypothetical protein n=1 Tax=uncultured Tateyamaria sp. TaxID=455651 RepID=UPI002603917A|nr:hypothetical protein [uncultured Tateyamaria sp.]
MITWTSKGLAIAACLALAGCDDLSNLNLNLPGQTAPLGFAELAGGAVTIVPPTGFCVDPRSLRQNFALMARCDVLGGEGGAGLPAAVITATSVATRAGATITPAQAGAGSETVLERRDAPILSMIRVEGAPPIADARSVYWRGAGQIGDHTIGLAIYQGSNTPTLGGLAPELLVQTMQRSQNRSVANTVARQDNSATLDTNPG